MDRQGIAASFSLSRFDRKGGLQNRERSGSGHEVRKALHRRGIEETFREGNKEGSHFSFVPTVFARGDRIVESRSVQSRQVFGNERFFRATFLPIGRLFESSD